MARPAVPAAGPLVLLTGFQTPAPIRQASPEALESWLRGRKVRNAGKLAAAAAGTCSVPGTTTAV